MQNIESNQLKPLIQNQDSIPLKYKRKTLACQIGKRLLYLFENIHREMFLPRYSHRIHLKLEYNVETIDYIHSYFDSICIQ